MTLRLAAVLVLGTAVSLRAQQPLVRQTIDSGTLVRLHVMEDSTVRGRLLAPFAPGAPTIAFCRFPGPPCTSIDDPGAMMAWPVATVQHVDVARGNGGRTGAIIGLLIGTVIGTSLGQFCIDGPCPSTAHAWLHVGLPFGAAIAALGWGIGSGHPHWQSAP